MTLDAYMQQNALTNTALAEKIGRSQSFVSRIRLGQSAPSLVTLQAIQRLTNGQVTPADFAPVRKGASQ